MDLFLLLIGLLTNSPLKHIHAVLYAISTSVPTGLNITSADFLGSMDDERFTKSRARWNSFIEAADLEVCSHMHVDSAFDLLENLGHIAIVSCPLQLDKTPSRCAQDFDTTFVFGGFKMVGRETQLLQIA